LACGGTSSYGYSLQKTRKLSQECAFMRVCWTYSNKYNPPIPVIHLSIHTIDIKLVYPTIGTQEVIVDTGYDGYVLVP